MVKGPVMSGSTEDENPYMYVDPKKYEGEDDNYLTTMVGKNTMEMYDSHAEKGYLEPVRGKQTMETCHPPLTSNEYFEIVNGKTTASDPSTQDGYLEIVRGKTTVPDPPPRNEYKGQKCGNKTIQTSLPQTGGAKPDKNQMTKVESVNQIGIMKTVLLVVLAITITAVITAVICISIIDDSGCDSITECSEDVCLNSDFSCQCQCTSSSIQVHPGQMCQKDNLVVVVECVKGPYGGNGGDAYSDKSYYNANGLPTAFMLKSGLALDGIQVTYGGVQAPYHGGGGGTAVTFNLGAGEYISKITGSSTGLVVNQLSFFSNTGANKASYGSPIGSAFEAAPGDNSKLAYVSGRTGTIMDQITFHFIDCHEETDDNY